MDDRAVAAYLERIGVARPEAADTDANANAVAVADAAALRRLHLAHQRTVPFENLSIHLGEPISLASSDLFDKIVTGRRGGFCYELNGLFALLLEALGVRVERLAARVFGGDEFGPVFDHLALVVYPVDGSGPWLADVGFGDHSDYPVRFDSRQEQSDPGGLFQLTDTGDGDVDVLKDGKPQYRIERRVRSLTDFVPTCWWQQTSPGSHFVQSTICTRLTEQGRVTISGSTLKVTSHGKRTEQKLTDAELLAAYREHFGFALDRVPGRPLVS
jgi:N-hydroxyarylamine O-acetyltransferase